MYTPVAWLAIFRILLATANCNNWLVESFNFDSAFLKKVFMEQPKGYQLADPKHYVFRLFKALYSLKQGERNWYEALMEALLQLGFHRTEADYGTFIKKWENSRIIILAVHINDCMITGSSIKLINKSKAEMNGKYKLTDLGPCAWLLRIKITYDLIRQTIALSQCIYLKVILTRFNFDDLKPSAVPMDHNQPLSQSQCLLTLVDITWMKNVPYCEAVGSLMYTAIGTRPDITFSISTVVQFMDNPGWAH